MIELNPEKKIKFARPNYFQGILQLRNVNNDVLDFVRQQVNKRDDVAITKVVKQPNGYDYYITSQKYLQTIGKKLRESFGGFLKTSSRLHTRSRTGKDLYRVNVLFKMSKYKVGSIVNVRGDDYKILRMGFRIFAKEVRTGRKKTLRVEDLGEE